MLSGGFFIQMTDLCSLGQGARARILHNWWRSFGSLKIMSVLIAEVAPCHSYRGTAAINTELGILKQNRMEVVWLPDTLTGLQRFQCRLEEHRPWLSEPVANFTSVWLPQYPSDPFQSKPVRTSAPFPLPPSLSQQLSPLLSKPHSLLLLFSVLMSSDPKPLKGEW